MNKDVCCRAVGKERAARQANKKKLALNIQTQQTRYTGVLGGGWGEGRRRGRAYFKWRSILYPLLTRTYFCSQISRFSLCSSALEPGRGKEGREMERGERTWISSATLGHAGLWTSIINAIVLSMTNYRINRCSQKRLAVRVYHDDVLSVWRTERT